MRRWLTGLTLLLCFGCLAPVQAARTFAAGQRLTLGSVLVTLPFTVCAWGFPTAASPTGIFEIGISASDNHRFTMYRDNSGEIIVQTKDATTAGGATTTAAAALNLWHHMCGVWASATSRSAYLNGGNKATNATNLTPTGMNQTIIGGMLTGTGNREWVGQLDHVAVWNVALTDAEIAALATGISPLQVRSSALVAYVPIWGLQSPEIDIAAARSWTLVGTPTLFEGGSPLVPFTPLVGGR
jgi:hypothetical protein